MAPGELTPRTHSRWVRGAVWEKSLRLQVFREAAEILCRHRVSIEHTRTTGVALFLTLPRCTFAMRRLVLLPAISSGKRAAHFIRALVAPAVAAALALLSLAAPAQETAKAGQRTPVPLQNYTKFNDLGDYVAKRASNEIYALFQKDKGLAVFAVVYEYEYERSTDRYCVAQVGLTHAPEHEEHHPRMPATLFFAGASERTTEVKQEDSNCQAQAVLRAIDKLVAVSGSDLKDMAGKLARTLPNGGVRAKEAADTTMMNQTNLGMTEKGNQWVTNQFPDWFARAFDYRHVQSVRAFQNVGADNGQTICWAYLGLTARSPQNRTPKVPVARGTRAKLLQAGDRNSTESDAACFGPLFEALIESEIQQSSKTINTLIEKWDVVAEVGLKPPTARGVANAVAHSDVAVRREATNQQLAQSNTCSVNCVNGNCVRTWPNGRSERFQAPRKFNPFTSQWEWDSGGC
jgi:hypothetical protein